MLRIAEKVVVNHGCVNTKTSFHKPDKFENPTQKYSDLKNCRGIRPDGYTCVSRQNSYRSVY